MPPYIQLTDVSVQDSNILFPNTGSTEEISISAVVNGQEVIFAVTPSFSGSDDNIKFGFKTAALTQQAADNLEAFKLKITSDHELYSVSHAVVGYWAYTKPVPGSKVKQFAWYGYSFKDILDTFSYQEIRPVWNKETQQFEDQLVTVRAPFQVTINGNTAEIEIDVTNTTFLQGQEVDLDPAAITGTTQEVIWGAGADPSAESVTVPSDATAAYMFWSYFNSTVGQGLSSVTLDGNSPDETYEIATENTDMTATGVAAWYNPSTGSVNLDVAWDASPTEGSTTIIAYVKGGDLTSWRDVDAAHSNYGTAVDVTIDTNTTDLVLKYDQHYHVDETAPSLSTGWSNVLTGGNNDEGVRLSSCDSPGSSTTTCECEDEAYSSIVAISIPEGAYTPIEKTATDDMFNAKFEL